MIYERCKRPIDFDPRMLGSTLKAWLDVSQSTADGNGVSLVPDRLGGPGATQSVNAQKPQLGTTSNGLSKLVMTDDALGMNVATYAAALQDANWFGMACWIKPGNIGVTGDLFNISTAFSGSASSNRIQIRQATDDLISFLWATASNIRRGQSTSQLLNQGVWTFFTYEFIGAGATEADKNRFKVNGTPIASRYTMAFDDAQNTVGPPGPSTLLTGATGSASLFARNITGLSPFIGEATDVFFYDPTTMTSDALLALAQYEVPVG